MLPHPDFFQFLIRCNRTHTVINVRVILVSVSNHQILIVKIQLFTNLNLLAIDIKRLAILINDLWRVLQVMQIIPQVTLRLNDTLIILVVKSAIIFDALSLIPLFLSCCLIHDLLFLHSHEYLLDFSIT